MRLEAEIVSFWFLDGPDRLPNPAKMVGCFAPTFLEGFGGRSGPFRHPTQTLSGSSRNLGYKSCELLSDNPPPPSQHIPEVVQAHLVVTVPSELCFIRLHYSAPLVGYKAPLQGSLNNSLTKAPL